jgi:predicted ester cyclase
MDPTTAVRLLVEAINRKDWNALHALLDPGFQRHSMAAGGSGVETASQFVGFLKEEHETYPDAHEELLDVFSSGTKVAARHLFTGTQLGALGSYLPTGRRVRSVYIALYRVEDGSIMESWAEWDPAADIRQLGYLHDSA